MPWSFLGRQVTPASHNDYMHPSFSSAVSWKHKTVQKKGLWRPSCPILSFHYGWYRTGHWNAQRPLGSGQNSAYLNQAFVSYLGSSTAQPCEVRTAMGPFVQMREGRLQDQWLVQSHKAAGASSILLFPSTIPNHCIPVRIHIGSWTP